MIKWNYNNSIDQLFISKNDIKFISDCFALLCLTLLALQKLTIWPDVQDGGLNCLYKVGLHHICW